MSKYKAWIGFAPATLLAFILGWLITDLGALYYIFFGKDVLNTLISLALVILTLILTQRRIPHQRYALPVFLVSIIITPHALHYLHNFPSYVTACYYLLIVLMALLVSSQVPKSGSPWWTSILVFVVGAGINELLALNNFINYLIIVSVITHIYFNYRNVKEQKKNKKRALFSLLLIPLIAFSIPDIQIRKSQKKYYDPVVFSETTPSQEIDITQWKNNQWYYTNGINLFSSVDYWLYYEPMVHPAMGISSAREKVLIIGGENGLAAKEVLKYSDTNQIDIIPLDTALVSLAATNPLFTKLNASALLADRVAIKTADVFYELGHLNTKYDIIIADLPDPKDIISNQYYTQEFYDYCLALLSSEGVFVTQSGSPYFATQAFQCINNTMQSAGFYTAQIHNQILTTGEWGWTIATTKEQPLDSLLKNQNFYSIDTQWINSDAMHMMLSFGKQTSIRKNTAINTIAEPCLYKYYNEGNNK
ncbi:MAG: hypothetical protein OCD76_23395 [Reichenbachiella sp.]